MSEGESTAVEPESSAAAPIRPRRNRRWVRVTAVVLALVLVPVLWSYMRALSGPGNDSLGARSVEWLRDNHLGAVVNWVEQIDYRLHPPRHGGVPSPGAGPVVATSAPAPQRLRPAPPAGARAPVVSPTAAPAAPRPGPPAPLASPASPALAGEGHWTPVGPVVAGSPGAYVTEIRPDGVHTSYLDAVVWFDPHRLSFRQFPGTFLPGAPWDRPPVVPRNQRPALVAAFEGGFRPADSRGGVVIGPQTVMPLRVGAATLAIRDDGTVAVGRFGTDIASTAGYDSLRQNLDLIVDAGQPVSGLATDGNRRWGFTGINNHQYVWRSGVGVTAAGDVVWVGGPALSIEDLARTLVAAGAVRAMELDINHEWVQLNTYAVGADGQVHGTRLLAAMGHSNDRYLSTDSRDFIAAFTRAVPLP